jgi:hypothetical protein
VRLIDSDILDNDEVMVLDDADNATDALSSRTNCNDLSQPPPPAQPAAAAKAAAQHKVSSFFAKKSAAAAAAVPTSMVPKSVVTVPADLSTKVGIYDCYNTAVFLTFTCAHAHEEHTSPYAEAAIPPLNSLFTLICLVLLLTYYTPLHLFPLPLCHCITGLSG